VSDGVAAPAFSILIGRVSTEDERRVLETLDALRSQDGAMTHEVILVDRRNDAVTDLIRHRYPDVRVIVCEREASLPLMRTMALQEATAPYVVVTEDHCVPPRNWLCAFGEALAQYPAADAIAGCVENGVTERALDWATYLCDYAAFAPPVPDGANAHIAGMNVVYRRAALARVPRERLERGFWETTLHPLLAKRSGSLVSTNAVRIRHCKRFSLRLFSVQRFIYSRYFAGMRFAPHERLQRTLAAGMTLGLPPLLLWRLVRVIGARAPLRAPALRALPYLILFYLIWAAGEIVGYARGPGAALREIE
jgi:hypothetical protein